MKRWIASSYVLLKEKSATPSGQAVSLGILLAIILGVSLYVATVSSDHLMTNSNALVDVYLFGHNFGRYPVTLPGLHSNILKIPLFLLQGHLPFTSFSYKLANIALFLATVGGWVGLLIKIFGKKYRSLIILLMASLIVSAIKFDINIIYTSVRNIEYPIALWFVLIIEAVLQSRGYSKKTFLWSFAGIAIFSVTLAGDSFFGYAVLLPIAAWIIWSWLQNSVFTRRMVYALGLIVSVICNAYILKLVLHASGLINFNNAWSIHPKVLPYNEFWGSTAIAVRQYLDLSGANIFGRSLHLYNFPIFLGFLLLPIGIFGLLDILYHSHLQLRSKKLNSRPYEFAMSVMSLSFFVIFIEYVLSGQVAYLSAHGALESYGYARYIAFLPLISLIGIVSIVKKYYARNHHMRYLFLATLLLSLTMALPRVTLNANLSSAHRYRPSESSIKSVVQQLKVHHIHQIITGYWYGASLDFWSGNTLHFAPQYGCRIPLDWNASSGWFIPRASTRSALVIDRYGPDASYWTCSNAQLRTTYGIPTKIIHAESSVAGKPLDIWLYNHDARKYLAPLPIIN